MNTSDTLRNPEGILDSGGLNEFWQSIRRELVSFLENLSDEDFGRPVQSGWNAAEITDHIYLSQWNFVRAIPIIIKGRAGEDTSDLGPVDYERIADGLSRPRGFKNPEDISPIEPPDRIAALANLDKAIARLGKSLDGRTPDELRIRGLKHPAFGLMPLGVFIWTMALHERMHFLALRGKM